MCSSDLPSALLIPAKRPSRSNTDAEGNDNRVTESATTVLCARAAKAQPSSDTATRSNDTNETDGFSISGTVIGRSGRPEPPANRPQRPQWSPPQKLRDDMATAAKLTLIPIRHNGFHHLSHGVSLFKQKVDGTAPR